MTLIKELFFGMKDPSKGGVYSECWNIPDGEIDEGETEIEALIREIKRRDRN